MIIKAIEEIQYYEFRDKQKERYVNIKSLQKRLNSVMNVRNNEEMMRNLIIDIQLELKNEKQERVKE